MKTKTILLAILATFITITLLSSCKKYVDGPMISLRTKKARVTGDWKLESATSNGTDITSSFNSNFEWNIEGDETFKMKAVGSGTLLTEITGTWKFGEDKDDIYFTPSGGTETSYRITRLKNKELWFYNTLSNGDKIAYKLKQ
ncbi:MAG: DUF5004 domain-containing protein [Bacteroidota bacterium]